MAGERFWAVGSASAAGFGRLDVAEEVEQLLALRHVVDGEVGGVVD